MLRQIQSPSLSARVSAGHRLASMRRFERLHTRVLMIGVVGIAVAATAALCLATPLLR